MPVLSLMPVGGDDLPFVRQMLHEAAFWRGKSDELPIDEATSQPHLAVYIDGWGRRGDRGVVARLSGEAVGAVWMRLFDDDNHGYGYVDDCTPELSIAVAQGHRGRGIGRCLMVTMLAQARLDGVLKVSLSVELDNPARFLYESLAFVSSRSADSAATMVRSLQ